MGGDDLGSDDELWTTTIQPTNKKNGMSKTTVDEDDDDDNDDSIQISPLPSTTTTLEQQEQQDELNNNTNTNRKRKIQQQQQQQIVEQDEDERENKKTNKNNNNNNKPIKNPKQLLITAGRELEQQDSIEQATFLNTALLHYHHLSNHTTNHTKSSDNTLCKLLPEHFKTTSSSNNATTPTNSLIERLKQVISIPQVKKWKKINSPCVIIICISARRAVQILKELSILKIRIAKLFPKNGSIDEQTKQLQTIPFGIAVGTPHRLLTLCSTSTGNSATTDSSTTSTPAFVLDQTQLIVYDSDVSNKQYTVCTLPDTAPSCMEFTRDYILPQLQQQQQNKSQSKQQKGGPSQNQQQPKRSLHLAFF